MLGLIMVSNQLKEDEIMDKEKILIEEIKVVQDIIKRMASNSFSVKTWTITLIVATLYLKELITIS